MRGSSEQLYRSTPNFQQSFKNKQAAFDAKAAVDRYSFEASGQNYGHKVWQFEIRKKTAYIERYKKSHQPPRGTNPNIESRLTEQDNRAREMILTGASLTPEWRNYALKRGIKIDHNLDNKRAS